MWFLQTLPVQPAPWETPGCVWPAQRSMSEERRPRPAPPLFLASPSQNVPLISPLSPIPGTRVMETMMTAQSTSPLVIWAVAASPEAPPTAVTKVSPRTGPSNRGPGLLMHGDGHRSQKARRGLDGGRKVTHAPSLTRVSIKSSEVVSKCCRSPLPLHPTSCC